jgi:hypothetical protein
MTATARTKDTPVTDTAGTAETITPGRTRGPIVRVVLGSILTGVGGAAASTLGVSGGAPEHVITASALLAFAAGWGMLAVLSARLTNQPQRWAVVPATAMASTGLGLLAVAPGTTGLTNSGWIWPPVMFALAIWICVRMRRALTGRVRWLLYPVIAAMALAGLGGLIETVALHNDAATAMPGTAFDVGGHRLHLQCTGTGSPTVVLESGLGAMSTSWARIAPAVAATTRVCAYDRAGQGWSGNGAGPQVAGMVLLDSSTPDQFRLPGYAATYNIMRRGLGVGPSLARLGIGRLVPARAMSSLPAPAAAQFRTFATSSRGFRNMRDEVSALPAAFAQAGALRTIGSKPLAVITATESLRKTAGWPAAQDRLAALSSNSSHRVVASTHSGLLDDVRASDASSLAITDVVRAVRTHSPLPTN